MIAANSVAIIIAYLLIITPLMIVLFPQSNLIKLTHCFSIQFIPMFSGFHIYSLMATIGFDRMLSILLPKWFGHRIYLFISFIFLRYISRNEYSYFALLYVTSLLFPIFLMGMAFKNILSQPNRY